MIGWREVLEQYPCEACGAAPGSPCVTTGNRPAVTPHAHRTRQAKANDWKLLDEGRSDELPERLP